MSVESPHTTDYVEVEEKPADRGIASIPAYSEDRPGPTVESMTAEGEAAYRQAVALNALHGLTADTVAEYRRATGALVTAGTIEAMSQDLPDDASSNPFRDMVIAECLGEQARATDIPPYEDSAYKPGGKFELIEVDEKGADGENRHLTPHQYLQWLSGRYLLRASVTLMGKESLVLAGEMTAEDTTEAIAKASDEAASDVHLPVQGYIDHDDTAVTEPIDPDLVRQSIKENADQGDKGAEYVVRMAEITRERLGIDTQEFSFGPELVSSSQAAPIIPR